MLLMLVEYKTLYNENNALTTSHYLVFNHLINECFGSVCEISDLITLIQIDGKIKVITTQTQKAANIQTKTNKSPLQHSFFNSCGNITVSTHHLHISQRISRLCYT